MVPSDTDAAFASITEDLSCFILLLATRDKAAQLAALRNIGDALLCANLTWDDLAGRITAPRAATAIAEPNFRAPPPLPPNLPPRKLPIDAATVLSAEDLNGYGFRQIYGDTPDAVDDQFQPR